MNRNTNATQITAEEATAANLPGMENEAFICRTPPSIIAETCIVAFTVLSYVIPKRADLIPLVQNCLAANIDKLLFRDPGFENGQNLGKEISPQTIAGQSVILRSRMSMLLGYYADMIFTEHDDAFRTTMRYLFQSMGFT